MFTELAFSYSNFNLLVIKYGKESFQQHSYIALKHPKNNFNMLYLSYLFEHFKTLSKVCLPKPLTC